MSARISAEKREAVRNSHPELAALLNEFLGYVADLGVDTVEAQRMADRAIVEVYDQTDWA